MTGDDRDPQVVVAAIITLGAVLVAAIAGMTVTAVFTDRDLFRAAVLTFGGVALLAGMGGVSLALLRRRRRWHVHVDRENGD